MNQKLFHYCSNKKARKVVEDGVNYQCFQQELLEDCGPEKAGVGGSSPSLATTF